MILPKNIIIVEDEVITQRYIKDILAQYDVNISGCFDNAADAKEGVKDCVCDMLLMDINIKGPIDGIQLARELVKTYDFPIVFITAHNDDNTFQEVLELAPYGFIEKPFSSKDIVFTLQLAYQRYLTHETKEVDKPEEGEKPIVLNKEYTYSRTSNTLLHNNKPVKLNAKQSKLLEVLAKNINHTVNYEMLIAAIWENDIVADSALRTLVYSIRKLLPELPIVSYSKIGYSLETNS